MDLVLSLYNCCQIQENAPVLKFELAYEACDANKSHWKLLTTWKTEYHFSISLNGRKKNGNNFFNVVFLVFLEYLYLFVVCTYLTYSSVLCLFDLISFYRLYLLCFKILFCYKIKKEKYFFPHDFYLIVT